MNLDFNLMAVRSTEFGVACDDADGKNFSIMPVDENVQEALKEMATDTWEALSQTEEPDEYQPSEKYASQEAVYMPLDSEMASLLRELHTANNIPLDSTALAEPKGVAFYFARFSDSRGRRLTAVRRASQFKGILKNRLIRLVSDSLKIVEDQTFKLDRDYDLLVDSVNVHVLRPAGLESIAELQAAICEAVPRNVTSIQRDMPFVEFSNIQAYAVRHTRAARHLASIRTQRETSNISQPHLKKACKTHGVRFSVKGGKIVLESGSEMGFLDILDRRMYELELVDGSPERYRASSRRKVL